MVRTFNAKQCHTGCNRTGRHPLTGSVTSTRDDHNIELHEDSGYKEYHTGVFEEHEVLGNPATLLWWYHA